MNNLFRILRSQAAVLTIFVLGYTITILAVLIVIGAAWGTEVLLREEHGGDPRHLYKVDFRIAQGVDDSVDYLSMVELIEGRSDITHAMAVVSPGVRLEERLLPVGYFYRRAQNWPPLAWGRLFTQEELNNGDSVAVIGPEVPSVTDGKEEYVDAFGKRWRVIGRIADPSPITGRSLNTLDHALILPLRAYAGIVDELNVDSSVLLFIPSLSTSERQNLEGFLHQIAGGHRMDFSKFWTASPWDVPELEPLLIMIAVAIGIVAFAMFNVLALIKYWVRRRTYEFAVRFSVGATRYDVRHMIMGEQIIVVTISYVISLTTFLYVQNIVTRTGLLVADSPLQIVLVGLIALLLALLVTRLSMREVARMDLVNVLRKAEM